MTAELEAIGRLRVASGFDVHPFVEGRPLVLGGVTISHPAGLDGHSDADVVAHAVTDAVLGGAGLDDIGTLFPSGDPAHAGADSLALLREAVAKVTEAGCRIVNADIVVMVQQPRLAPYRQQMRDNVASALGVDVERVNVRATTTDRLGFVGREEGAAALATALVLRQA